MRKKFVTVLACIILVPVLLLTALCIYHQIRLKKERSIINHTLGQFVEVDGHNMNIYTIITLLGGLAMFLYGMRLMGDGLKESSSGTLKRIMGKVTDAAWKAFLLKQIL